MNTETIISAYRETKWRLTEDLLTRDQAKAKLAEARYVMKLAAGDVAKVEIKVKIDYFPPRLLVEARSIYRTTVDHYFACMEVYKQARSNVYNARWDFNKANKAFKLMMNEIVNAKPEE